MPKKWFLNKQMIAVYHSDRSYCLFSIVWVGLTENFDVQICVSKKASNSTKNPQNTQDEHLENQLFYSFAIIRLLP